MSILTKPDIYRALLDGTIRITSGSLELTPDKMTIGPNSIDLHLHPHMKTYKARRETNDTPTGQRVASTYVELDARGDNPTEDIMLTEEGFVMCPGTLYLARTIERTYTPHHVPKIGGRSSTGRLGINIHQTAGFGDVGFDGTWTLELSCVEPVRIYPAMRIAQLWLFTLSSPVASEDQYQGRYQGQEAPTEYRGHLDDADG